MFDEDFVIHLEYAVTAALEGSEDIERRRCWCDGILIPATPEELAHTKVNNTKHITTQAWIDLGRIKGKDQGQQLYTMVIWLGKKALKKYMNGKRLEDCIPGTESDGWIDFDWQNHTIEIRLP